ncbi:MAG: helix-turn-helix transcriptional regulator [Patescibacteria group bacterium]|jgi:transcriptional regulator with XRE-family HTH domain
MDYQEFKIRMAREKLKDKNYKKNPAVELALQLAEERISHGMTQKELAKKIGTKQPSIARLESGIALPSLSLLEKIAKVYKKKLILPSFEYVDANARPSEDIQTEWNDSATEKRKNWKIITERSKAEKSNCSLPQTIDTSINLTLI